MNETIIALIVTSIVSIISLVISIKNYIMKKPKLKIAITEKNSDVIYGDLRSNGGDAAGMTSIIGCVYVNIINDSPVDIEVKDIKVQIGQDLHRLIDKHNSYWEHCYFYYMTETNEERWDGTGIYYKQEGISVPLNIRSYSIKSGVCLFYHFPDLRKKKIRGKLILYSAIGKITRKIKFVLYNEKYQSAEMKDVKLYLKNTNGRKK